MKTLAKDRTGFTPYLLRILYRRKFFKKKRERFWIFGAAEAEGKARESFARSRESKRPLLSSSLSILLLHNRIRQQMGPRRPGRWFWHFVLVVVVVEMADGGLTDARVLYKNSLLFNLLTLISQLNFYQKMKFPKWNKMERVNETIDNTRQKTYQTVFLNRWTSRPTFGKSN